MPRANTQAVRISNDLIEAMKAPAIAGGRSIPMEIEYRLRQSLEASVDARITPWAQAIGRLMALLGDDLAASSQSADGALAAMKAGSEALLDGLLDSWREVLGADEVESEYAAAREHAEGVAHLLAQRVRQAHEPKKRAGDAIKKHLADKAEHYLAEVQPSLRRLQQSDLLKLQTDLFLSPEFLQKVRAKLGK